MSYEVADPHPQQLFTGPRQLTQHFRACVLLDQSETVTIVWSCYSNFHIENGIETHPRMFLRLIFFPTPSLFLQMELKATTAHQLPHQCQL